MTDQNNFAVKQCKLIENILIQVLQNSNLIEEKKT